MACLVMLLPVHTLAQETPAMKRVLLLHREGVGNPFRAKFDAAFADALRAGDPGPIDLYEETLETERFPGAEQAQLLRDYLKNRYAGRKIDAIVTVGDAALAFARDNRSTFGDPPIAALVSAPGQIAATDNTTGIQGGLSFGGTIEFALAVRPDTQRIFVVNGSRDHVWQSEPDFERLKERIRPVTMEYLRDLPLNDLTARLAALPEHSIVFFIRQTMRDESHDLEQFEGLAQVAGASTAPVFGIFEYFVGRGIVGGQVWRYEEDARRLAGMALQLAHGASVRDVPPARITNARMADWQQLRRWQIPESRLPAGTIVLFGPQSFFDLYRQYVVVGAIVFAAQLALIAGMFVQNTRRQRAEEAAAQFEARNSAILRAIPDLMFVLLRDGTYADYHAREPAVLFVPPDRFMGRTVREILPPAVAEIMMGAIERVCATGDPVVVEYELAMSEQRYYEARLVPAGQDRVLSIVRDVTESKRAIAVNRDLAGRLITSQEVERARIARDLHDDVCQEVAGVAVDISNLVHRRDIRDVAVQSALGSVHTRVAGVAESLRLLSHDLHPSVLQHIGLVPALESHCAEVERHHDMQVQMMAELDIEPVPAVGLALFRISQEALRNAARHGQARHATVSLSRSDESLTLSITDDGVGFDVASMRHDAGLGLVSIEERARLIKGVATISSQPRKGTTVEVHVPLTEDTCVSPA